MWKISTITKYFTFRRTTSTPLRLQFHNANFRSQEQFRLERGSHSILPQGKVYEEMEPSHRPGKNLKTGIVPPLLSFDSSSSPTQWYLGINLSGFDWRFCAENYGRGLPTSSNKWLIIKIYCAEYDVSLCYCSKGHFGAATIALLFSSYYQLLQSEPCKIESLTKPVGPNRINGGEHSE